MISEIIIGIGMVVIFGGSGVMLMYGLFVAPFRTMNKELENENIRLRIELEKLKNKK